MKKLITAVFAFIAIASMTVLSSCGGAPSNEDAGKIVKKYERGGELTEGDYGTLISYISAAVDDVASTNKQLSEEIKNESVDDITEYVEKIKQVGEKYEYIKQAQQIVKYSGTYIGDSNHDKLTKLRERIKNDNIYAPFLFI